MRKEVSLIVCLITLIILSLKYKFTLICIVSRNDYSLLFNELNPHVELVLDKLYSQHIIPLIGKQLKKKTQIIIKLY
jgi:hypothetical protein